MRSPIVNKNLVNRTVPFENELVSLNGRIRKCEKMKIRACRCRYSQSPVDTWSLSGLQPAWTSTVTDLPLEFRAVGHSSRDISSPSLAATLQFPVVSQCRIHLPAVYVGLY